MQSSPFLRTTLIGVTRTLFIIGARRVARLSHHHFFFFFFYFLSRKRAVSRNARALFHDDRKDEKMMINDQKRLRKVEVSSWKVTLKRRPSSRPRRKDIFSIQLKKKCLSFALIVLFLTAMVGGERDLPSVKRTNGCFPPPSFFLSVSLSAPTFGSSIRARDTTSTFFFSRSCWESHKNTKNRPKTKKKVLPPAKEKFQTFFGSLNLIKINDLDSFVWTPFS